MGSSTETSYKSGISASCIFQKAEGVRCGEEKVYGANEDGLRFCWEHYALRCAHCGNRQALGECTIKLPGGTICRTPLCSEECIKAHRAKEHANWQPLPPKVTIRVIFADGGIHEHLIEKAALVEEIVFENPNSKAHARCLRRSDSGAVPVYVERPAPSPPTPAPLEISRPVAAAAAPSPRSGASLQKPQQNAVLAFSQHVSWLLALLETHDERILKALPRDVLQKLEGSLTETTIALLEANLHGG